VLVRIDDENDLEIVKQLLRAHEYWRLKRLAVDLVILNDRPPSYASDLQQALDAAISTSQRAATRTDPSAARCSCCAPTCCRRDPRSAADRGARVFVARRGTLSDQLARLREPEPVPRRRLQAGDAGARRRRTRARRRWNSSTASAALPRTPANTSWCSTRVSGRRRPGSM
jgi:cyclic beta-1,2-glucan synthetase